MSETIFLIKAEELGALDNFKGPKPDGIPGDFEFKGYLISPSIDDANQPAMYLNAVFGIPGSDGHGDIIIQNNILKACPYPPGYGL